MNLELSLHYLAFTGDFDFGAPARTLRAGRIFQQGNDKTTRLLRGTLNVGDFYQEGGSTANGHGNTFILDSPDARMEASSFVGVGTKPRNDTLVVTNGAALVTSSLSVGRDAYTYPAGIVASNNLLHVTGEGTSVTVSDLLSTGIRQDNRIEIDDHAVVTAKNVRLAVSNYDNEGDWHLYDSAKRLRIAGGARLICNPTGGFVNGEPRLTVGWHTGSNMLEVADGGELICYILAGVSEWKFENGVAGFGFLALAVMIFGQWKPTRIAAAALVFGLFRALSNVYFGFDFLVSLNIPGSVYNMMPYVISLVVLAFTSKHSRVRKYPAE